MNDMIKMLVLLSVVLSSPSVVWAKLVEYQFDVDYKTVNFTGKAVQAMTVGGTLPAPTIEATVGDTLRVTFHNKMDVETSVHWHGILLPNDQDGVPYLTAPPIAAGTSFTYEYPVIHHGTYWYHSHTGLQEQRGVYGALVFHPKEGEQVEADHEAVVVLSDWTDEDPNQVMHNLKKSDDYYALKKDSVQSWAKVIQQGSKAIKHRLDGALMRMGPMDISDVGYDTFLANGQKTFALPNIKAGETVRLRLINAGASSYFNVAYAGGPMTIVAADGVDVVPFDVVRQRMAIAETYDVIVTVPDHGAYEFRATSQDGTGYSSVIMGEGVLMAAPTMLKPEPMMMDHAMHNDMDHENHAGMKKMDHAAMGHSVEEAEAQATEMMEYELLRSPTPTHFNPANPKRTVQLALTGDMERYAWSFNNKVLSESSQIMIRRGETVQFVLENKTMMAHPIHLHGHFFRVLNGQGDSAPLKHTVNVPAMKTVTIEFLANEEKDWFFHCHNLYHMKSGMTRVVSYEATTQLDKAYLSNVYSDRHWFYFADLSVQSHFTGGEIRAENTRNAFNVEYDWNYEGDYEVEATYERSFNRFFELYIGGQFEREDGDVDNIAVVGAHYLLPLLIEMDLRLDNEGQGRLGFSSELQLTNRTSFEWDINTDHEYRLQLEYEINKLVSIVGSRDDQYDWGVGVEVKF